MASNADFLMLQAQSQSAKNQMAFQERMSNTAHQREVADLKKAGLNPVLSAGGSGASTPNGAAGDLTGLDLGSILGAVSSGTRSSSKALKDMSKTITSTVKTVSKVADKAQSTATELGKTLSSMIFDQSSTLASRTGTEKNVFGDDKSGHSGPLGWLYDTSQDLYNSAYNNLHTDDPKNAKDRFWNAVFDMYESLYKNVHSAVANSAGKYVNRVNPSIGYGGRSGGGFGSSSESNGRQVWNAWTSFR